MLKTVTLQRPDGPGGLHLDPPRTAFHRSTKSWALGRQHYFMACLRSATQSVPRMQIPFSEVFACR